MASMIRTFEGMRAPLVATEEQRQAVIEEHRRLQPLAINIVVADSAEFEDDYLRFVAMPGKGLIIGYHSARHEAASAPLLEHCAVRWGIKSSYCNRQFQVGPG